MAKLQAATVSNQIVRKRKRKTKDDGPSDESSHNQEDHALEPVSAIFEEKSQTPETSSTTTVPTKTQDGGKKTTKNCQIQE